VRQRFTLAHEFARLPEPRRVDRLHGRCPGCSAQAAQRGAGRRLRRRVSGAAGRRAHLAGPGRRAAAQPRRRGSSRQPLSRECRVALYRLQAVWRLTSEVSAPRRGDRATRTPGSRRGSDCGRATTPGGPRPYRRVAAETITHPSPPTSGACWTRADRRAPADRRSASAARDRDSRRDSAREPTRLLRPSASLADGVLVLLDASPLCRFAECSLLDRLRGYLGERRGSLARSSVSWSGSRLGRRSLLWPTSWWQAEPLQEGDLAEVHQAATRLAEARLRQPARAQASPWRARVDACRRDRHGPDG